jgi:hypothetical protein
LAGLRVQQDLAAALAWPYLPALAPAELAAVASAVIGTGARFSADLRMRIVFSL